MSLLPSSKQDAYFSTCHLLFDTIDETQMVIESHSDQFLDISTTIGQILNSIRKRIEEVLELERKLILITKTYNISIDKNIQRIKWSEPKQYKNDIDIIYEKVILLRGSCENSPGYSSLINELKSQITKTNENYSKDKKKHDKKKDAFNTKISSVSNSYVPVIDDLLEKQRNSVTSDAVNQRKLVDILKRKAGTAPSNIGIKGYFRKLIQTSNLPDDWKLERIGALTGDAEFDAIELITWAIVQGRNRTDTRFTTLGSLLKPLLPQLGVEDTHFVVALISGYGLYLHNDVRQELEMAYQIPKDSVGLGDAPVEFGPDITWLGPSDEVIELQGLWGKSPDMLDVGFLQRALVQSRCVCRIENTMGVILGTGFLIGKPNLLLTNYHVLKKDKNDDLDSNIRNALLRFGCFTEAGGDVAKGRVYKLAKDKPPLAQSPANELDFLLLQVDSATLGDKYIESPALWDLATPALRSGLHILQHPEGEAMKLAITSDAVVYRNNSLIQYVTSARSGSSGSPCFNDDWKVVALHHAQRSKRFGSVREGILFQAIYERIKVYL